MQPFRYHVFVCTQQKPEGVPGCAANGSYAVLEALQKEVVAAGLDEAVQITTCGSVGLCERGPNLVVYPDGVWYSGVQPSDVPEIVAQHFAKGQVVARLANADEAALRREITESRARARAMVQAQKQTLPEEIMAISRGFMESRALLTAIELDLFSAIRDGATAAQAAEKLKTDPRAMESLLNVLVAMKLATKADGVFRATPNTARFLADSLESVRMAMMHTAHLWHSWSTLTEAVRTGTSVYSRKRTEEFTEAFISAMHRNASSRAAHVVRALDIAHRRRVLDVGGGSGAYSIAFAQANPKLRAVVFDLGPVITIATRHIDEAGLGERVKVSVGDFHTDSFGEGYDMVFLSAICHMNSPEENVALLKKAYAALIPGGEVVIQDYLLNAEKTAPRAGALFALNMLVGTRAGSSYSEPEYRSWLAEAGFEEVKVVQLPGPTGLMTGVRR